MNVREPIIRIEELSHSYGSRTALADLSLQVHAGEIFGFLGPNGSGKTTLFRVLSTLVLPRSGRVSISGLDVAKDRDAVRRQLGVVFQSPSLDRQLTAEENLRHHGHLYGLRGQELSTRMLKALEQLNLADRARERVETFSGGMRRRVELAKGMLTHPRILLLDEPSTGLDPGARIDLWQYLGYLQRELSMTILLTTHLMDEADRCTRLAILDQGRLVACDTPAALKERIGGDVITMTSASPQILQKQLLDKFVIEAEQVDGTVRIERARGHELVPQLIEALPGLIESVSLGKPTLEDVFIRVTGHSFS
jgi:ABC-2 type transport system ATP-binding protein